MSPSAPSQAPLQKIIGREKTDIINRSGLREYSSQLIQKFWRIESEPGTSSLVARNSYLNNAVEALLVFSFEAGGEGEAKETDTCQRQHTPHFERGIG